MAGITMTGYQPPHALAHQAGGIDPLNLALIAGQIAYTQHPVGIHDYTYEMLPIPITSFMATEGSPALTQYGVGYTAYIGWAFDPAADETITTQLRMPQQWMYVGAAPQLFVEILIGWCKNAASAPGVVAWRGVLSADNTLLNLAGTEAAQDVGSAGVNVRDQITLGVSAEQIEYNDIMKIHIRRRGSVGADTLAVDAILTDVTLLHVGHI